MTNFTISNYSILTGLTSNLQREQSTLTQLVTQLSSSKQHTDLTDYTPSEARQLISLQSTATQSKAYLSVIATANSKLSVYNTTMTDMESIVSQAQTLVNNSPNYTTTTASNILTEANNYLRSMGIDLNQQLNGQYLYSGTRYTTAPVADLTTLPVATLSPTTITDGATLPSYDSQYGTSALTMTVAGQNVTIGGTVSTPLTASAIVNGVTYNYLVQAADTPTTIASSLAALIAVNIPGTSSAGPVITVGATGTVTGAGTGAISYTTDSAIIDTNYTLNYGVSSNNPAFQQVIAGLRYMQAAGN